jgi:hypothetical protein
MADQHIADHHMVDHHMADHHTADHHTADHHTADLHTADSRMVGHTAGLLTAGHLMVDLHMGDLNIPTEVLTDHLHLEVPDRQGLAAIWAAVCLPTAPWAMPVHPGAVIYLHTAGQAVPIHHPQQDHRVQVHDCRHREEPAVHTALHPLQTFRSCRIR